MARAREIGSAMRRGLRTIGVMARWAAIFAVVALCLMPIAWAVATSLQPLEATYQFPPEFRVSDPRWSNYGEVFHRLPLASFILNSLWITAASVAGAVLTSAMTGYALARSSPRAEPWLVALVVATLFVPAAVTFIPRFLLFTWLGWMDTYKPLIVPSWLGGGAFNILLFRAFFRRVPKELEQAAAIDGATPWQAFWRVLLPAVRPATMTAIVLSFAIHWRDFMDPLIYLSDFHKYPASLGLRMYQSQAGTWSNLLMAASIVTLVPVVVVFLSGERWLMRGMGVEGQGPLPARPRRDEGPRQTSSRSVN